MKTRFAALLRMPAVVAALLAGCATQTPVEIVVESSAGAAREGVDLTESAAADAFGLPRERPGGFRIDNGDVTVPTPYGGYGAETSCFTVARDIARITVVLGADAERHETGPEAPDAERADEDESLRERGEALVEDAPDAVREGAADAYRSAIVGLNPARPVIRFLGRAGEIDREARRERELMLKRRAYLRGWFDAHACDTGVLADAAEAYGLSEPAEATVDPMASPVPPDMP